MQLPVDHKWDLCLQLIRHDGEMITSKSFQMQHTAATRRSYMMLVIWTYFVEPLNFPIVFFGLNLPNCIHEPTINQPSTNHRPDFPAVQPLLFRFSTKGGDPCGITNRASQQFIEWSATTGAFNNRINNLNMFKWMDIYVYIYIYIFMLLGLWMTDINWTNMEQY